MRMHPLELIERLRDIFPDGYKEMSAGCIKFHILLRTLYPQSKGYYNSNHVLTEIDSKYYDFTGEVKITGDYLPITHWSKAQLKYQWENINSPFINRGIDQI